MDHIRKTKVVCTLGPTCEDILPEMIEAGMNVARFNFSHGDHAEHEQRWQKLQAAIKKTGKRVAVLLDTQGPKVRTGTFANKSMEMVEGELVYLYSGRKEGGVQPDGKKVIFINYPSLLKTLSEHRIVYFADGLLEVHVQKIEKDHAVAKVVTGGKIGNYKGVNIPHAHWDLPAISEKDKLDVEWGVKHDVDFIAQSFVLSAKDVQQMRKLLDSKGAHRTKIVAKIEEYPAVQDIDNIMKVADAIMVARGDLGVQTNIEHVPIIQKMLIKKCNFAGKPVITATQMLESMTTNTMPTRAEVTDVANAILDGTDAVMLSGETSAGKHPLRVVQMMVKVINETETRALTYNRFDKYEALRLHGKPGNVTLSIGTAACRIAQEMEASCIIAHTDTGQTAQYISRFKPSLPILAVTPFEKTARQLCLSWGVVPAVVETHKDLDKSIQLASKAAKDAKVAAKGSLAVVVAGLPFGSSGHTNLIKTQVIE